MSKMLYLRRMNMWRILDPEPEIEIEIENKEEKRIYNYYRKSKSFINFLSSIEETFPMDYKSLYSLLEQYNNYKSENRRTYMIERCRLNPRKKKDKDLAKKGYKYKTYQKRALSKRLDFTLSLAEFISILNNPCTYCGSTYNIGIDRIDSLKGYTPENSTPCCSLCNQMKWDNEVSVFLEHIRKIANYNE